MGTERVSPQSDKAESGGLGLRLRGSGRAVGTVHSARCGGTGSPRVLSITGMWQ